jgi:hypothetical protein
MNGIACDSAVVVLNSCVAELYGGLGFSEEKRRVGVRHKVASYNSYGIPRASNSCFGGISYCSPEYCYGIGRILLPKMNSRTSGKKNAVVIQKIVGSPRKHRRRMSAVHRKNVASHLQNSCV